MYMIESAKRVADRG